MMSYCVLTRVFRVLLLATAIGFTAQNLAAQSTTSLNSLNAASNPERATLKANTLRVLASLGMLESVQFYKEEPGDIYFVPAKMANGEWDNSLRTYIETSDEFWHDKSKSSRVMFGNGDANYRQNYFPKTRIPARPSLQIIFKKDSKKVYPYIIKINLDVDPAGLPAYKAAHVAAVKRHLKAKYFGIGREKRTDQNQIADLLDEYESQTAQLSPSANQETSQPPTLSKRIE